MTQQILEFTNNNFGPIEGPYYCWIYISKYIPR